MRVLDLAKLIASGGLFVALLVATADSFGITRALQKVLHAEAPASASLDGRTLFLAKGCVSCHSVAGVPGDARVGPNLTGLPSVAGTRKPGISAADYVRESLVEPQAYVVPGYAALPNNPGSPSMPKLPLTKPEVDALVAFLLAPHMP